MKNRKICKDTMNKIIATNNIKNLLGYGYLFAPVGSVYILAFQCLVYDA